jgi:hypothetical protein
MGFDDKIMKLSRTIYQMSVMSHTSKNNPTEQIDKIRAMIREFIRLEVVPYELTNQEKITFILENEAKINSAVMNGHKASNEDEFQPTREKIRQYRIQLGIIDETGKLIKK